MWVTENHTTWLHPEPPRTQLHSRHTHSQNVPGATSEKNPGVRAGPALARVPSEYVSDSDVIFFLQWKEASSDLYSVLSELTFSYFCSSFV